MEKRKAQQVQIAGYPSDHRIPNGRQKGAGMVGIMAEIKKLGWKIWEIEGKNVIKINDYCLWIIIEIRKNFCEFSIKIWSCWSFEKLQLTHKIEAIICRFLCHFRMQYCHICHFNDIFISNNLSKYFPFKRSIFLKGDIPLRRSIFLWKSYTFALKL